MSFTERVFGWALKQLWIVLVFSILIKPHYIGLIFKNNKLPQSISMQMRFKSAHIFRELSSGFFQGDYLSKVNYARKLNRNPCK